MAAADADKPPAPAKFKGRGSVFAWYFTLAPDLKARTRV